MDHLLSSTLCGLAFALPWGGGGSIFGGTARVFAYIRHRTPEVTLGGAFAVGARSGAAFCSVLGFIFGVVACQFENPQLDLVRIWVMASCLFLGPLAIVAAVLGAIAYGLEWLGS